MTTSDSTDLAAIKKEFLIASRNRNRPLDFFPHLKDVLLYISMNDCAVVSAKDGHYYIGTSGLSSCAGIAVYDPQHHVGGVAHISFNPEVTGFITKVSGFQFSRFSDYASRLISAADKVGGDSGFTHFYDFYAFNIEGGSRTKLQNNQLTEIVEDTIQRLRTEKKILNFYYRNERAFLLNTKTGDILPNL